MEMRIEWMGAFRRPRDLYEYIGPLGLLLQIGGERFDSMIADHGTRMCT